MKQKIVAKNREDLLSIIKNEIELNGNKCSLNHIDVSNITQMYTLFKDSKFNGDISQWDVSKVECMDEMFRGSSFNGDISRWNVSSVISMRQMFGRSKFNGDISKWDVSNVKDMSFMFANSKFFGDLTNWKVISLKSYLLMFNNCKTPQPYWAEADNASEAVRKYLIKQGFDELTSHLNNKPKDERKKTKI